MPASLHCHREMDCGKPYDLGQPIGLDANQERAIVGLVIEVAPSKVAVCGKDVLIKSVKVDRLTPSGFLAKYTSLRAV